jgi:hypothetical protein
MNSGTRRTMIARDRSDAARIRPDLVARVMTRVALEPRPTPARSLAAALRRGSFREAVTSVATAWRLGTMRGRPVALGVRVRSLALAVGVTGMLAMSGAIAFASVASAARHVVEQTRPGALHVSPVPAASPTTIPSWSPPPLPAVVPLVRVPRDDHDADVMPRELGRRSPATTSGGGATGTPAPAPAGGPAVHRDDGGGSASGSGGGASATTRPTVDGGDGASTGEPGGGSGGDGAGVSPGTDAGSPDASASPEPGPSGAGGLPSDGG